MKKQLLLLAMILLPMVANAYDIAVKNADGVTIYYNYTNDGTELAVTHRGTYHTQYYDEYKGNVVIPEEVTFMNRTRKVTSIDANAFDTAIYLTSVTIPSSVTSIGQYAFQDSHLTSVTIGNSVTSIGQYAFEGCFMLTSVTIPNSVTSIGEGTFRSCSGLTSVTIGNSVTSIGQYAFDNCYGLTSVTIPNNVTSIGDKAFYLCTGLTSITIGNSVTSIGSYAFCGCSGLTSVTIPNSVTSIDSYAFYKCSKLTSITIGNSVTSIGKDAFYGCSKLTSVTIPNSVTSIGKDAFYGCSSLTSVTIGSGVTSIGGRAFYGWNLPVVISLIENPFTIESKTSNYSTFSLNTFNNATLYVPVGTIDKYKATEGWKDFLFIEEADFAGTYKLTYMVDGEVIKSYDVKFGTTITPEPAPKKEGHTFSGWSEIPETMPAHDVTVTGTFAINKYKIIYKVDGAEYRSYELEYGAKITPEPEPTKEGYTFSGWSEIPTTMPAHDVMITGTFAINKYKLVYKVDGTEYKSYELEFGAKITPEPAPTKEGYTFSGWSEIPETMPAHDVTVTGTFTINKYKLVYKVDGAEYKSYEMEFGAKITPESAPTKEGYTFSGWSEIPETMPAHDVTISGTFAINKYKLIYKVDGAEYKTYELEYGAKITPEPEPTKEGYTFSGWSEIPATMPAHDVTVTGTFTKGAYKLTYMVDGEVYKTISYDYGAAITPEPAPMKMGYTFSGWSEIPATMPAHDVTITGTFTINKYKLIYKVDGAEYKSYELEFGTKITPEPAPTKEGYTFSGWSEIPKTMPAYDVTVTGSFIVNQYTITYVIDNEVYTTQRVDYGSTIIPPTAPEREGYDFAWGDYPETMPAYDITIYGTYTTGIEAIMAGEANCQIFSSDGKPLNELQKGVNIVRMSNGKVRKIVVK